MSTSKELSQLRAEYAAYNPKNPPKAFKVPDLGPRVPGGVSSEQASILAGHFSFLMRIILTGAEENADVSRELEILVSVITNSAKAKDVPPSIHKMYAHFTASFFSALSAEHKNIVFSQLHKHNMLEGILASTPQLVSMGNPHLPPMLQIEIQNFLQTQKTSAAPAPENPPSYEHASDRFKELRLQLNNTMERIKKSGDDAEPPEKVLSDCENILIQLIVTGYQENCDLTSFAYDLYKGYRNFDHAEKFGSRKEFKKTNIIATLSKAQQLELFAALKPTGYLEQIAQLNVIPKPVRDNINAFLKNAPEQSNTAGKAPSKYEELLGKYIEAKNKWNSAASLTKSMPASSIRFTANHKKDLSQIALNYYYYSIAVIIEARRNNIDKFNTIVPAFVNSVRQYDPESAELSANAKSQAKTWFKLAFGKISNADLVLLFEALEDDGTLEELLTKPVLPLSVVKQGRKWREARLAAPAQDTGQDDEATPLQKLLAEVVVTNKPETDASKLRHHQLFALILIEAHKTGQTGIAVLYAEMLSTLLLQKNVNREVLEQEKRWYKQAFKTISRDDLFVLFDALHTHGQLSELLEQPNMLPFAVNLQAKNWLRDKMAAAPENEIPAEEISEEVPEEMTDEAEDALKVVIVDDLLPEGESDDIGVLGLRGREFEEAKAVRTQPRFEWIREALLEDGFSLRDMVHYEGRKFEGIDPRRNPYAVLEICKDDHHFQVAFCDIMGNATYVIKNPVDLENTKIEIAELKKRDDVFQFSCYNREQLVYNMRHYAYTALDELGRQLKTRIGWGDKKDLLINAICNDYIESGQIWRATDHTIIKLGEQETTRKRAYYALYSGTIPGLEHVKNFRGLLEHALGPLDSRIAYAPAQPGPGPDGPAPAPAPAPEPEQAPEETPKISIRDIFKKAVTYMQTNNALYEDAEMDELFTNGKDGIADLATMVDEPERIGCLKDFLVAAGLASNFHGHVIPASPETIKQFARFLAPL